LKQIVGHRTTLSWNAIVDVVKDGLHAYIARDTFVAGERGDRGSITGQTMHLVES
jgi:hypothetical protein